MTTYDKHACLKIIKGKDAYTYGHCMRVAYFSRLLCQALNLKKEVSKSVEDAALVHDIGKVMVPDEVLNKPGALTNDEFKVMKEHTTLGLHYLETHYSDVPDVTKDVVVGHHLSLNGKGYPIIESGNTISLEQRIVTICDIFDGIASKRTYRETLVPVKQVLSIMQNDCDNGKLDTSVFSVFKNAVVPNLFIDWSKTDEIPLPFLN